jgi:hypothetical protein
MAETGLSSAQFNSHHGLSIRIPWPAAALITSGLSGFPRRCCTRSDTEQNSTTLRCAITYYRCHANANARQSCSPSSSADHHPLHPGPSPFHRIPKPVTSIHPLNQSINSFDFGPSPYQSSFPFLVLVFLCWPWFCLRFHPSEIIIFQPLLAYLNNHYFPFSSTVPYAYRPGTLGNLPPNLDQSLRT